MDEHGNGKALGGHVTITFHGSLMDCESAIDRRMVGEVFAGDS